MMAPYFIGTGLLLVAFAMGFVASRTTLCSVRAVNEILFERRTSLLVSYGQTMLWVVAISLVFEGVFGASASNPAHFSLQGETLAGGFLFGVGAAFNGGCSLHTFTRLGQGDFAMAISIFGLSCGALLVKLIYLLSSGMTPVQTVAVFSFDPLYLQIITVILSAWMAFRLLCWLWQFKFTQAKTRLLAVKYDLSNAAMILGIGNGLLFVLVGTWMYTNTLIQSLTNVIFADSVYYQEIPVIMWLMLVVLLAGVMVSAALKGTFKLLIKPSWQWLQFFFAGSLMGGGAALIPGGNDTLLLNAIPSLSP
ncbi:MAG: putative membrane protein YedE/YeeE, partial [Alteromonadaceae bacterium]